MTTGPRVGSSSVACETPAGVITSTAFGTVPGSTEQIGAVPGGPHTPNRKGGAVGANPRAWSGLNPSCPVSTTVKPQPEPGVPKADSGSAIVMVPSDCDASTCAGPTELADAPRAPGRAGPSCGTPPARPVAGTPAPPAAGSTPRTTRSCSCAAGTRQPW